MPSSLDWIGTTGGPHLLVAEELVAHWRGIEGWFDHCDPADHSDYARACRINNWMGHIQCHTGSALVLSGDVGAIAWLPTVIATNGLGQAGFFIQWLGIDDEFEIEPMLRSKRVRDLLGSDKAECSEFQTGPSGRMVLLDAADNGFDLVVEHTHIELLPGAYVVRANYVETSSLMMVVRELGIKECL